MAGTYWLTILPDTKNLKPGIQAALAGTEFKPKITVDKAAAKKVGEEAAKTAGDAANKRAPKVKPTADKPAAKKAGEEAAEESRKPVENKRPKVKPQPDLPGSKKAGEDAGKAVGGGIMSSLKMLGPLLGGAAIFGGLKTAVGQGMDFTESLNVMQGVTGATGDQMARVSELANQLGVDVNLAGVNANDAAQALTALAKGGMNVDQSMSAVRGSLALAGAAGIDAAQAAEIQSDALHTFGLSATEAGRVADLLTNSANASTVEVPQMAQALAQAGSAASGFGIGIEDTLTSLAMFANFGIKGSDAGTLMKTSLLAITNQGNPAQGAIKELGLSLYDTAGKFVGYPSMLKQVAEASKNMKEEQFQAATAVLFGSDAMRGSMIAAKGGADAFDQTSKAVRDGAGASQMAAARMQGLPGAWANFQNTLDGVKMKIYEVVQGPLESLLNKLTGIPDFVTRNSTAFKILGGVIMTVAIPAMTLWAAAQAKAIATSAIAGLASMVGAWGRMASVLRLSAAAQWALNVAMSANPIGLIIAGLVAVGVALWAFFTKTETGRKMWAVIWEGIKTAAAAVWDWMKGAIQAVGDVITWLWQNVAVPAFNAIKTAIQVMWAGAQIIWEAFKAALQFVGDKLNWLWNNVAVPAFNAIRTGAELMWAGVKVVWDTFTGILTTVGDKFTAFKDKIVGVFNSIKETVERVWDRIGGIIDKIKDFATSGPIGAVVNAITGGAAGGMVIQGGFQRYAGGGRINGPGTGTSDSILGLPAMVRVANGEYIVNAESTAKYLPLIQAINAGKIPGFAGGGFVSANELVNFAQGVEGKPYVWGGTGWGDCSGAVSALANYATGQDAFASRFATGSEGSELAKRGFKSGIGPSGSLSIGWYNGGPGGGHTAATLPDGTRFEMGGKRGNGQFGGGAAGAGDSMFTNHAHLPPEFFSGLDGGAPTIGGATSASGSTYRAATSSELSASSNRVSAAGTATKNAQQSVDDHTFRRDEAQKRLDKAKADGKDTTSAQHSLDVANRELADANDRLAKARDKESKVQQEDTDLRTNGKLEKTKAEKSSSGGGSGKGGANTGDLGKMFVGGVLESIGLDGSLFSNPLEWPSVKSLLAGVNFAGGLLSIAGARPDGAAAGGGGSEGGFFGGAADAVGLGGLMSAIPRPSDFASGSPALAPGEFNPAVAGGRAVSASAGMSTFAPAPHQGGGQAPGPAVDNSINFNGNVGMSPDAIQTKFRSEQAARTRTTVVK